MGEDNLWRDDMVPGQLVDRRSEGDRRKADNSDFFARGGIERRRGSDPRRKRKGSLDLSRKAGPQDLELECRGLMRKLEKEALEDSAIHF